MSGEDGFAAVAAAAVAAVLHVAWLRKYYHSSRASGAARQEDTPGGGKQAAGAAPFPAGANPDALLFDVFAFAECVGGGTPGLVALGRHVFQYHGLLSKYNIDPTKLDTFLHRVNDGMTKHGNPYHNGEHRLRPRAPAPPPRAAAPC